jgi:DNA-binding NarL/FixJ family response regulator
MDRIPVVVHAPDPISQAGVVSGLRGRPELTLVDTAELAAVAVIVAETVDDLTLATLRRFVRSGQAYGVLIVSQIKEAQLLDVVEGGAVVILWRQEASADGIARAVLTAARGNGNLPADLLGRLLKHVGRIQRGVLHAQGYTSAGLAEREREVLSLVAEGLDTAEIATKLAYSERTVKNVLHGLTNRLRLRNRSHAVAYAIREGYI